MIGSLGRLFGGANTGVENLDELNCFIEEFGKQTRLSDQEDSLRDFDPMGSSTRFLECDLKLVNEVFRQFAQLAPRLGEPSVRCPTSVIDSKWTWLLENLSCFH